MTADALAIWRVKTLAAYGRKQYEPTPEPTDYELARMAALHAMLSARAYLSKPAPAGDRLSASALLSA